MNADQKDDATFKAVLILIDSLPAGARAFLRDRMVEQGVTLPPRLKPGRKPKL
jgi:hypothetical protein